MSEGLDAESADSSADRKDGVADSDSDQMRDELTRLSILELAKGVLVGGR